MGGRVHMPKCVSVSVDSGGLQNLDTKGVPAATRDDDDVNALTEGSRHHYHYIYIYYMYLLLYTYNDIYNCFKLFEGKLRELWGQRGLGCQE